MNGVIVEIKKDQAIVLSEDGSLTQVRNRGHQIGEVIPMKTQTKSRSSVSRKFAAMAASIAALLLVGGGSAWAYATPYSYVSLDVNPSITYTVNMFDRVIDYTYNPDGGEMLSNGKIQLKNMSLEQAVKATIEEMEKQGYLKSGDENKILVSAASSSDERTAKLVTALEEEIADIVEKQGITDAAIEAEAIGLERVELARQLSEQYSTEGVIVMVAPGKLNLVEKLNDATSTGAFYGGTTTAIKTLLLDTSVKEIMEAVKEQKGHPKDQKNVPNDDKDKNPTAAAIQNQNKPDDNDENDQDENDQDENDQYDHDKNATASAIKNGKGNTENPGNKGDDEEDND